MFKDSGYLLDIYDAGQLAVEFSAGMAYNTFIEDLKTQAAVIQKIQIMGEAVKRLSEEFKQAHPDVPWREIAGMRDKLIHDYHMVDLERVWLTLNEHIPRLLERLSPLLPTEE